MQLAQLAGVSLISFIASTRCICTDWQVDEIAVLKGLSSFWVFPNAVSVFIA